MKFIFFLLRSFFVLVNSVDPDEMLHYAAIYLCLHCLPKYSFRSQQYIMDCGLKFSMELSVDSEQLGYTVKPV